MANDSVGKISLDLELQGDIEKQISEIASKIGEQLKAALQNAGKLNFKGMADTIANTIKKALDNSMKGLQSSLEKSLNSAIAGAAKALGGIKIPINFEVPENMYMPKQQKSANSTQPRAPPVPKINLDALKAQIENLIQKLDIINAKIEIQKEKLAGLKEAYANTFNPARKIKIQEQILKTEETINRLTAASDKAGFKLADLDAQFAMLSNAAKNATAGINATNESLSRTGNASVKTGSGMKNLGNSAKHTGEGFRHSYNGAQMFFDSLIKWGIVFPAIISGLGAMASFVGSTFMTNTQFANSLNQIKSNLMTAFMPIYQAVLPAVNTLMNALSRITAYIASFTSQLFGKTYESSFGAAKSMQYAIGAYNQTEKQAKKTAESLGGVGKSAKSAADAAKKAGEETKKGLAGFDQINKLSDSSSKAPTPAGDGVITPITPMANMAPIEAATKEWVDGFKKILATLFQPFRNAWAKDGAGVMGEFNKAVEGSKLTIKHFFDVLATPPVQKFIENVARLVLAIVKLALKIYDSFILPIVNWFISLLPKAANGVNPILEAVTKFIKYLSGPGFKYVQIFLSVILGLIGGFKIFNTVTKIISGISSCFSTLRTVISGVWGVMMANPIALVIAIIAGLIIAFIALYNSNESFRNKVNEVVAAIANFFTPTLQSLKATVLDIWNNALVPLGKVLMDIWQTVIVPLSKVLQDVLAIAFQVVASMAKDLWNNVLQPLGSFLADIFTKAVQAVIDIYNAWKPVIQEVINVFMYLWNNVLSPIVSFLAGAFAGAFTGVTESIKNIIGDLKNVFSGLIDFVAGIFTGNWTRAWNGIVEFFKGLFGGLGDIVKTPINAIIGALNGMIKGINKIGFDIPDWLGGGHFGINIPSIPYLAKGGIIDQPTLAMVGEAGKEAVVPLENNTGGLDLLAEKLAQRLGGNGGSSSSNGSESGDVIIKIGESEFARIAISAINKRTRMTGKTELIL
ncbi:MAG: hypothetical protein Q8936_08395 [Bacillota bacterium]|nr:hypothetical protein [Bacillota bacterium]